MQEEPQKGGEGVVNCVFRCPTGSRISRNFMKSEKLSLLKDWVYVQEEKGFENNDGEFSL